LCAIQLFYDTLSTEGGSIAPDEAWFDDYELERLQNSLKVLSQNSPTATDESHGKNQIG
jgi:hypothetical protein